MHALTKREFATRLWPKVRRQLHPGLFRFASRKKAKENRGKEPYIFFKHAPYTTISICKSSRNIWIIHLYLTARLDSDALEGYRSTPEKLHLGSTYLLLGQMLLNYFELCSLWLSV